MKKLTYAVMRATHYAGANNYGNKAYLPVRPVMLPTQEELAELFASVRFSLPYELT